MLKARKPRGGPESAIGLIAAKPLKPCDGGVFGALDSLLKKERWARNPKRRNRRCLAAAAYSLPFIRAACLRFGGTVAQNPQAAQRA